ncbi:MAG: hypothetical protein F6K19_39255 [Cyanothece sp. SIO1E1]|nr:hypothetical protein [Cyanothece sp. SIO1E1]
MLTKNLGEIQTRRQAEIDAVKALEQAQNEIERLLAAPPYSVGATVSQLQSIVNELKKIDDGTTVYLKAQDLLLRAQNKLNQLEF